MCVLPIFIRGSYAPAVRRLQIAIDCPITVSAVAASLLYTFDPNEGISRRDRCGDGGRSANSLKLDPRSVR